MTVGITGGIGSGKSYVCDILREKGFPVYSCDDEAKRLMGSDEKIISGLCKLVGNEAYTSQGSLNKAVVANFLFQDAGNAAKINSIVHPRVMEDFKEWASGRPELLFMECAILFEASFDKIVDKTLMVYAPKEIRLERAMRRDSATKEQVEARMRMQMSDEEKRSLSDFCLINDGVLDVREQLLHLFPLLNV